MKKLLVIMTAISILFTGCNLFESLEDAVEKREHVQNIIKEKYGYETEIYWRIQNGKLTQVTVAYNIEDVKEKKVSDLMQVAVDSVLPNFEEEPRTIFIQVYKNVKEKT